MAVVLKEAVGHLLRHACASIQYRVRSELLSQPDATREMKDLQQRILKDEAVRKISRMQRADGSLGTRFHTAKVHSDHLATEVAVRLLCEKGVSHYNVDLHAARFAIQFVLYCSLLTVREIVPSSSYASAHER